MALFRRKRRQGEDTVGRRVVVTDHIGDDDLYDDEDVEVADLDDELDEVPEADEGDDEAPDRPREETGPFDVAEVDELGGRLDLGSLWLWPVDGLELQIEIDDQDGSVRSVTAARGGSAMQLQVFAAPRSSGIWKEVRTEIAESVVNQGGTAETTRGPLGVELLTRLPAAEPGGRTSFRVMRFVGVDGPRWFLRAVLTGDAADPDAQAGEDFFDVLRRSVVVRGDEARPPREMLPLTLPAVLTQDGEDEGATGPDLNPFERGPEITEIH